MFPSGVITLKKPAQFWSLERKVCLLIYHVVIDTFINIMNGVGTDSTSQWTAHHPQQLGADSSDPISPIFK